MNMSFFWPTSPPRRAFTDATVKLLCQYFVKVVTDYEYVALHSIQLSS